MSHGMQKRRQEPNAFVIAAARAQKAADFILGRRFCATADEDAA